MLIATIEFQSGSASLREPSAALLDDLVATLRDCPDTRIRVEGHGDPGTHGSGRQGLGQARADAVVSALAARAVDPSRVVAVGYEPHQVDPAERGRRADLLILDSD